MIPALVRHFPQHVIGYSDHTLPNDMKVLEVAALLGAQILEKHFSHDKTLPGNDHYHAMDYKRSPALPPEFRADAVHASGKCASKRWPPRSPPARTPAAPALPRRPATSPPGRSTDKDDLTWKRPAGGISPRHYYEVLGTGRPRRHRRKIPSSSGRIWNKKRMCGKGLEKVPFPPPYPLRVASFPTNSARKKGMESARHSERQDNH